MKIGTRNVVRSGSAWGFAGFLFFSAVGQACDTPVYLYSLQNWPREPYQVFYFYRGAEDSRDAAANRYLNHLSTNLEAHANLRFDRIDVDQMESTPARGLLAPVWARHQSDALPFHLVLNPRGEELLAERLDLAGAKALVGSPKRTQMIQQLTQDKQGLLLLLQGSRQAENISAERLLKQVVEDAKKRGRNVGLLTVGRKEKRERWFVQQLLRVEDDLKDLPRAMVFAVFGRGYVMPPCLGRGITEDNLEGMIEFMNGPCTCEIKAANPGLDLLTDWDWEAHIPHVPVYTEAPLNSFLFDVSPAPPAEQSAPTRTPGVPLSAAPSPSRALSPPGKDRGGPEAEKGPLMDRSSVEVPVPAASSTPPRGEKKVSTSVPPAHQSPGSPSPSRTLEKVSGPPQGTKRAPLPREEEEAPETPTENPAKGVSDSAPAAPSAEHSATVKPSSERPQEQEFWASELPIPEGLEETGLVEAPEPSVPAPSEVEEARTFPEIEGWPQTEVRPVSAASSGFPSEEQQEGPSFSSTLARGLGLALGSALILVAVIGLVMLKRKKEG